MRWKPIYFPFSLHVKASKSSPELPIGQSLPQLNLNNPIDQKLKFSTHTPDVSSENLGRGVRDEASQYLLGTSPSRAQNSTKEGKMLAFLLPRSPGSSPRTRIKPSYTPRTHLGQWFSPGLSMSITCRGPFATYPGPAQFNTHPLAGRRRS